MGDSRSYFKVSRKDQTIDDFVRGALAAANKLGLSGSSIEKVSGPFTNEQTDEIVWVMDIKTGGPE